MPLPQQGLQAEAERGREGGKKRERSHVSLGREGGEERKRRKTSPETEIVTERQRKPRRHELQRNRPRDT